MTFESLKNSNITSCRCTNQTDMFPNSLVNYILYGFPALVEPVSYNMMKKRVLLLEQRYIITMMEDPLRESFVSTICTPLGYILYSVRNKRLLIQAVIYFDLKNELSNISKIVVKKLIIFRLPHITNFKSQVLRALAPVTSPSQESAFLCKLNSYSNNSLWLH